MRVRAIPGRAFGCCAKFVPNLLSVGVQRLELALNFECSFFEIAGEALEQSDDGGGMQESRLHSAYGAAKIFRLGPEVGHLLGANLVLGLVYAPSSRFHYVPATGRS
jgi:hypothetical protein